MFDKNTFIQHTQNVNGNSKRIAGIKTSFSEQKEERKVHSISNAGAFAAKESKRLQDRRETAAGGRPAFRKFGELRPSIGSAINQPLKFERMPVEEQLQSVVPPPKPGDVSKQPMSPGFEYIDTVLPSLSFFFAKNKKDHEYRQMTAKVRE